MPNNVQNEPQKILDDIVYPGLNAAIHCSYKEVKVNCTICRRMHIVGLQTFGTSRRYTGKILQQSEQDVYGIYYDLQGDVASVAQFTLTDSTQHFQGAFILIMS